MAESADRIPTERQKVFEEFNKQGRPYKIESRPHYSTRPFSFAVAPGPTGYAFLTIEENFVVDSFFIYGINDSINDGLGNQRIATRADTDLLKGATTTGDETFLIHGISVDHTSTRIKQARPSGVTDPLVTRAFDGKVPVMDPGAIYVPLQVQSPANLEDALWTAIAPLFSITLSYDEDRIIQLGTLDQIPQGGPKSFLRAFGEPHISNMFPIREGLRWCPAGTNDSNLRFTATCQKPVCVPISLLSPPGNDGIVTPVGVALDICLTLHGERWFHPSTM